MEKYKYYVTVRENDNVSITHFVNASNVILPQQEGFFKPLSYVTFLDSERNIVAVFPLSKILYINSEPLSDSTLTPLKYVFDPEEKKKGGDKE